MSRLQGEIGKRTRSCEIASRLGKVEASVGSIVRESPRLSATPPKHKTGLPKRKTNYLRSPQRSWSLMEGPSSCRMIWLLSVLRWRR